MAARRNGRRVLGDVFINDPEIQYDVQTKTDDYSVLVTDSGKTLVMNSSSNKGFTLPSVAAGDVGLTYTFTSIGSGKCTITASDSDRIDDSNAGGHIDFTFAGVGNELPTVTLRLVSSTHWAIIGANGTINTDG